MSAIQFSRNHKKSVRICWQKTGGGGDNIKNLSNHFSAYFQCKSFPFTHCALPKWEKWTECRNSNGFFFLYFLRRHSKSWGKSEEKFGNKNKNLDNALLCHQLFLWNVEMYAMRVCHYEENGIKSHKNRRTLNLMNYPCCSQVSFRISFHSLLSCPSLLSTETSHRITLSRKILKKISCRKKCLCRKWNWKLSLNCGMVRWVLWAVQCAQKSCYLTSRKNEILSSIESIRKFLQCGSFLNSFAT